MTTQQYQVHGQAAEAYGSRVLYGAIVAIAVFLLVASVSSFGPPASAVSEQHHARGAQTVETIVATPGQST